MRQAPDVFFQGDVMLRRVRRIPEGLKEVPSEKGNVIVTHSETGHHHVVPAKFAQMFATTDPLVGFLSIRDIGPAPLTHLRDWDTHEPWELPAGSEWEVVRQREQAPEGWRQVQD